MREMAARETSRVNAPGYDIRGGYGSNLDRAKPAGGRGERDLEICVGCFPCPQCYRARIAYARRFGQSNVAGGAKKEEFSPCFSFSSIIKCFLKLK